MSADSHREMLGAYVLNMLEAAQQAAVSAHVDGCAQCRAELDVIAPAARLLPRADVDRVVDHPAVPPQLGDLVIEAIRRERSARTPRRRAAALAAAGAAVVVFAFGAGVAASWAWQSPEPEPLEPVATQVADPDLEVSAALIPHSWGMEIRLTGSGFDSGETYRAAVFAEDGQAHPAGEFIGVGDTEMVCHLNSSLLRGEAAGFEIVDDDGRSVLTSSF